MKEFYLTALFFHGKGALPVNAASNHFQHGQDTSAALSLQ
jgi:hypothetical protein